MDTQTYTLGQQIMAAINNKKTIRLEALDVHELTPLTDLFIIAVASNERQTKAIADEVEEKMAVHETYALHKEGYQTAQWILLDYGDVIIHILEESNADFYGLDRLWKDAKVVEFAE